MVHTQGHGFRWGAGSSALHCAQRVTARGLACPAHRGRRVPLGLGAPEVSVEGAAVHFSSKDRLALNPQGARAAGWALSVRAMRLHTPQVRGQGSGVQAETRCACAGPGNAALCPVRPRRSPGRTAPLYCADGHAAQRSRGARGGVGVSAGLGRDSLNRRRDWDQSQVALVKAGQAGLRGAGPGSIKVGFSISSPVSLCLSIFHVCPERGRLFASILEGT